MAGDRADDPLMVRLYLTPRFADGVTKAELLGAAPAIQRETMLVWFLANFEKAKGTFFGFDEARPTSADQGNGINPDLHVAGFNQAPMFEGGHASELIGKEFGDAVGTERVEEVATGLPGLWMLRTDESPAEGSQDALVAAIDRLTEAMRQLPARAVDRLHNQPPDAVELNDEPAVLTVGEKDRTLRATASIRMAVLLANYTLAAEVWEGVKPIVHRVGAAIARYTDLYCTKVASGLADVTVAAVPGVILACLHVVDSSAAIDISLSVLAAVSGGKTLKPRQTDGSGG